MQDRNDCSRRAALEKRDEQTVCAPQLGGDAGIEQQRPPAGEEAAQARRQRLWPLQDRLDRLGHSLVANVQGLSDEGLAALIGHPDSDSVEPKQLGERSHERLERRLEREALGERPRDLVEGAQRSGGLLLRFERFTPFGISPLQLLVEARVLDGDRELRGERGHQSELVRRQRSSAGRIDGEQSDQVLANAERQADCGFDARFGKLLAHRGEPEIRPRVVDQHRLAPAQRASG